MLDPAGNFIGQICHIEAAMPGGERFNALMSNEDRRSEKNLILMCYGHHVATNDIFQYPVYKLQEIKRQHEQRFSDPSQIMLCSLTDSTLETSPVLPRNLGKLFRSMNWGMSPTETQETFEEAIEHIQKFVRVPLETRHFLGQFAFRLNYLKNTSQAWKDGIAYFMPVRDVENTFRLDETQIKSIFSQMMSYNLGNIEEVSFDGVYPPYGAFLYPFSSDWNFWLDVSECCRNNSIDITAICDALNFGLLDD